MEGICPVVCPVIHLLGQKTKQKKICTFSSFFPNIKKITKKPQIKPITNDVDKNVTVILRGVLQQFSNGVPYRGDSRVRFLRNWSTVVQLRLK